nr:cation:proton antiporter [Mycobacterium sp.]
MVHPGRRAGHPPEQSVAGGHRDRWRCGLHPGSADDRSTGLDCAWFTDTIGSYAIFGAFILGVAMPSGFFATDLTNKLEPLTTTLLLPLFFVYSGLNTTRV